MSAFHHSLSKTPAAANRAVEMLFRIYRAAEERETIPEGSNPCRQVAMNRQGRHERFLTDEEFRRLGRVLDEAEAGGGAEAHAAVAIRLLLLTGCRKSEVLKLCWDDVDLAEREMRLPDSKTGPRTVQLSPAAAEVLARAPRVEGNPHVVPGMRPGTRMCDLQRPWERIRKRAGLEGLRLHDCRHSFASRALALGESLPTIGKLLGHSHMKTTARYAHLARDSVHESAGVGAVSESSSRPACARRRSRRSRLSGACCGMPRGSAERRGSYPVCRRQAADPGRRQRRFDTGDGDERDDSTIGLVRSDYLAMAPSRPVSYAGTARTPPAGPLHRRICRLAGHLS